MSFRAVSNGFSSRTRWPAAGLGEDPSNFSMIRICGINAVLRILLWQQRAWDRASHQTGWTGLVAKCIDMLVRGGTNV